MAKFSKRIARPGTYTVRRKDGTVARVYVGKNRIKKWVNTFGHMKELGLQVPAPWRHEEKAHPIRLDGDGNDSNAYNNAGFWDKLYVGQDGALWGDVDVPRDEDADRVGKTVQDVSLLAKPSWVDGRGNTFEDALTHIALVTHPVDKDSQGFVKKEIPEGEGDAEGKTVDTVALSLNDLTFADGVLEPNADAGDSEPDTPINASAATVADAIRLLGEIGNITLPEDTSRENFVERLVVALSAIRGRKEDEEGNESVTEPPPGSKKQPGPVAMSKEQELALSILSEHNVTNPDTGKPYTLGELQAKQAPPKETLQLSQEDQAAVNWARSERKQSYKSRIEDCVKQGRVDPKTAEDFWKSLEGDNELQFSFNADGQPMRNQYDFVLEAWEKAPRHGALTGHSPTSARAAKTRVFGEQAFSLGSGVTEEPKEDGEEPPMSEEDVDKVLNMQFVASGKRAGQVEGGIRSGTPAQ